MGRRRREGASFSLLIIMDITFGEAINCGSSTLNYPSTSRLLPGCGEL
jgi:hypothetical protein